MLRALTTLTLVLASTATAQDCFKTRFDANSDVATGGAIFFTLEVRDPIRIESFDCNLDHAGGDIGLEVWMSAGARLDRPIGSVDSWSLVGVDDGDVTWAGADQPTRIDLAKPIDLYADSWTIGLVVRNGGHRSTKVPFAYTTIAHGPFDWHGGIAQDVPFSADRGPGQLWNGTICYSRLFGIVGSTNEGDSLVDSGEAGVFDVLTDRPIRIDAFQLMADDFLASTVGLDVYTRRGGHVGLGDGPVGWSLERRIRDVECEGLATPTRFEVPGGLELVSGTTGVMLVPRRTRILSGPAPTHPGEYSDGVVALEFGATTLDSAWIDDRTICGAIEYTEVASRVETTLAAGSALAAGGAMYFDLSTPEAITLDALEVHVAAGGTAIDLELFAAADGWSGNESDAGAWQRIATGSTPPPPVGASVRVPLAGPVHLLPGDHGLAVVVRGADQLFTEGTNGIRTATDGLVKLRLGAAADVPFAGGVLADRIWNGAIHYFRTFEIGAPYCDGVVPNSTGRAATLVALGASNVHRNDLTLVASTLPPHALGYFLTSPARAVGATIDGSQGVLCLGGDVGRHAGSTFDAGALGSATLRVDLDALPGAAGPRTALAGESWNFQAWYRDVNPGPTSNFTDAVGVTFDE